MKLIRTIVCVLCGGVAALSAGSAPREFSIHCDSPSSSMEWSLSVTSREGDAKAVLTGGLDNRHGFFTKYRRVYTVAGASPSRYLLLAHEESQLPIVVDRLATAEMRLELMAILLGGSGFQLPPGTSCFP